MPHKKQTLEFLVQYMIHNNLSVVSIALHHITPHYVTTAKPTTVQY